MADTAYLARTAITGAGSNRLQPVTTLRGWLDHLAVRDRLAIIQSGIPLEFELAAIAKRLDGEKATLFPHPDGHAIPVISGLVSDRQWIAEAMGVDPKDVLSRFQDAALNPLPWKEVKDAPVQQVVQRDVDLYKQLPLPVHNEHDNGAYITAGLLIARNPVTGIQNVSIHRLQVSGPNRLGALLLPRHTHMYFEMAESAGQPLDVAIVVGVDPLTLLFPGGSLADTERLYQSSPRTSLTVNCCVPTLTWSPAPAPRSRAAPSLNTTVPDADGVTSPKPPSAPNRATDF